MKVMKKLLRRLSQKMKPSTNLFRVLLVRSQRRRNRQIHHVHRQKRSERTRSQLEQQTVTLQRKPQVRQLFDTVPILLDHPFVSTRHVEEQDRHQRSQKIVRREDEGHS